MIRSLFLVGDDKDDQFFFQEALAHVDPTILFTTAGDGVEAMENLEETASLPDIIFLDNNMPRMNGLDCLRELKAKSHLSHIPVIIYSTAQSPEFQAICKEEGAFAYLQKPNDFPALVNVLTAFLSD